MLPPSSPSLPALSKLTIASLYLWSVVAGADTLTSAPNAPPIEPQMVDIPAGQFTMGCVDGRDNVYLFDKCTEIADELPAHKVTVKAFQMGKYEVTVAEWAVCVAAGACSDPKYIDENWNQGKHPVTHISWDTSQIYLAWLNKRTGKHYRLPTEAEWEYAARGGGNTAHPWGNVMGKNKANCHNAFCQDAFETLSPVGSFAANAYGLHDIDGNVAEWCQDQYHNHYQGAPNDGSAWIKGNAPERVLRGGTWESSELDLRLASRGSLPPDSYSSDTGFRLVLDQE